MYLRGKSREAIVGSHISCNSFLVCRRRSEEP